MKKLFVGLLVGTMALAAQITVFAANNPIIPVQELEGSVEFVQAVESLEVHLLTDEEIAQMEKEQVEKLQKACEEAGYDYETIKSKMEAGTLTKEEEDVLAKAGIFMAINITVDMMSTEAQEDTVEAFKMVDAIGVVELKKIVE